MKEIALNILKKLEKNNFQAYIVGGFVRDYLLGKDTVDVDIITNATPKEIKKIFKQAVVPKKDYEALNLFIQGKRFDITTFRKELTYQKNRKPLKIEYISSLYEDLKRRDFKMNTLCMDSSGEIIDLLNAREDIENKVISAVQDVNKELSEDPLRILRAIRFYTILEFDLDKDLIKGIKKNKKYLKNLSYERKKEELDLIFASKNIKRGVDLIKELKLDKELEIYNLKDIKYSQDLIGVWASLDVSDKYPFSKNEKDLINSLKSLKDVDLMNKRVLYDNGLYIILVAGELYNYDKSHLAKAYEDLIIKERRDIDIKGDEIVKIFNKKGPFISDVFLDLENKILNQELENNKDDIIKYIEENYGDKDEE